MSKYLVIRLYDGEGTHVSNYGVDYGEKTFQTQKELEEWIDNEICHIDNGLFDWEDLNGVEYNDGFHDETDHVVIAMRKSKSILKHYHPILGKDFDFTVDFRDREPAVRWLGYVQEEES